jgi:hypothetical protein
MEYTPKLSKETQKIISGLSGKPGITGRQVFDKVNENGRICEACQNDNCDNCDSCICNSFMCRLAMEAREEEIFKRRLREGKLSA